LRLKHLETGLYSASESGQAFDFGAQPGNVVVPVEAVTALFGLALGGFWFATMVLFSLLSLAGTALWIWMLVEVLTRETDADNNRLVWLLVVLLASWVGALVYLLARRPARIRNLGK